MSRKLSNESIKPAKLRRHLQTKLSEHISKSIDFFEISTQGIINKEKYVNRFEKKLEEVVKVVNFIKARPLNSQVFKVLCEEMGSQHTHLLLRSEVRWLSRGKVFNRLFELRDEIRLLLMDKHFELNGCFNDFSWLAKVAFLAGIFTYLNELNLILQSAAAYIFKVEDNRSDYKKIDWCSRNAITTVFMSLPTLNDFIETSNKKLPKETRQIFVENLLALKSSFRNYYPSPDSGNKWIRDPFNKEVTNAKH